MSILASLSAIVVFLSGALAGGWLALHAGHHRGRLLAIALYIEIALVGAAFIVSMVALDPGDIRVRYVLIVLLAVAMGLQTAAAHRLAVPDLTTTVLTSTLAAFAADSRTCPAERRASPLVGLLRQAPCFLAPPSALRLSCASAWAPLSR